MPTDSIREGFYFETIEGFLDPKKDPKKKKEEIKDGLTKLIPSASETEQEGAWVEEINILREVLESDELETYRSHGAILLEYNIPDLGKRIDAVLLLGGVIFVLEFKVGKKSFLKADINQTLWYARCLSDFHKDSHGRTIVPILVATNAPAKSCSKAKDFKPSHGKISSHILSNRKILTEVISGCLKNFDGSKDAELNPEAWAESSFSPSPTIIETLCALYEAKKGAASETMAQTDDLEDTSKCLVKIIKECRDDNKKAICFVTGVPGAGKTLVGLDVVAHQWGLAKKDKDNLAVYLSGNEPLVRVLTKALSTYEKQESEESEETADAEEEDEDAEDTPAGKGESERTFSGAIRMIYHYRNNRVKRSFSDDKELSPIRKIIINKGPPIEHVAIFDEAQRSWTSKKLADFMKQRGFSGFPECSEPEFLISCLERHEDWAVIICLVGGGQEIHDGEAGIAEWIRALHKEEFSKWNVYIPDTFEGDLVGEENEQAKREADIKNRSVKGNGAKKGRKNPEEEKPEGEKKPEEKASLLLERMGGRVIRDGKLNLPTEKRTIKRADLYPFIESLLERDEDKAKTLYEQLQEYQGGAIKYPIYLTRSLEDAKKWIKEQSCYGEPGEQRCGLLASAGAKRLRPLAIDVRSSVKPEIWFLEGSDNVRSSSALEEAATEFDVQGLEIEWSCVVWDADLRCRKDKEKDEYGKSYHWEHHRFRGSKWDNVNNAVKQRYLENAYRVLLTRARRGMVIVVPEGDKNDITKTRLPEFYNGVHDYLKACGIKKLGETE